MPNREDIKALQGSSSAHKKELEDLVDGIEIPKSKIKLEVVIGEKSKFGKASLNTTQYFDAMESPVAFSPKTDDNKSVKSQK